MTVTIKQAKGNGYYVEISQDKYNSGYKVASYPLYDDDICGYALTTNYYGDIKSANKQFNRLKRRYEICMQ